MAEDKNKQLRKKDEAQSKVVSDFLDLYFYPKFSDVERKEDKETQVSGIDITLDYNGKHYLCDEKASVQYINKPLYSFALELSRIIRDGKGTRKEGWYLSNDCKSNSYLFVWVDKADTKDITSINEIREVEVALLDKNSIVEELKRLGWDNNKLKKKSNRIVQNPKNENMGRLNINGCAFRYNEILKEKPVNILLPRKRLIELSDYHEVIKK